jgi:hypothetical protein
MLPSRFFGVNSFLSIARKPPRENIYQAMQAVGLDEMKPSHWPFVSTKLYDDEDFFEPDGFKLAG